MVGQNIARLTSSVAGMSESDVGTSRRAWQTGADALDLVSEALANAAPKVLAGFGEKAASGRRAAEVLDLMRTEVLGPRRDDMNDARAALQRVEDVMVRSKTVQAGMPPAPGPAPTLPGGTGDDRDDVTRMKIHANQTRQHNAEMAAYAAADERARVQVEELNRSYEDEAAVMARIHGEPVRDTPGGGAGGACRARGARSARGAEGGAAAQPAEEVLGAEPAEGTRTGGTSRRQRVEPTASFACAPSAQRPERRGAPGRGGAGTSRGRARRTCRRARRRAGSGGRGDAGAGRRTGGTRRAGGSRRHGGTAARAARADGAVGALR